MKTIVTYKSYLGSAKTYATWLAAELHADLVSFRWASDAVMESYDTVVVCSGTYAARMPLTGFLRQHWPVLQSKKVFAIAVGIAPPDDPQSRASYETIPADIRSQVTYFKLPGKLFGLGTGPDKQALFPVIMAIKGKG